MKWWALPVLGVLGSIVLSVPDLDSSWAALVCVPLRLLALVVLIASARRLRAADPGADAGWWWIAAGIATWLGADVLQYTGVSSSLDITASGVSSVYLSAYPPLLIGLLLLTWRASAREERLGGLLDGAAVAVSLALAGLVLAVGRSLEATAGDELLGQMVDVAFTVGDVLLIALATCLVSVSQPRPVALIVAAATLPLALLSDCLWLLVPVNSALIGALNSLHLLCHLSWAGAAVVAARTHESRAPRPDRPAVESAALSPRRLAVLAVAGALPAVLLGTVPHPPVGGGYGGVVVGAVVLGVLVPLLVLLRLVEALRAVRTAARAVAALHQDLEHQATHDALTGPANRPRVRTVLAEALGAPAPAGGSTTIGLLFIDLDGFKAVNDTHGHRAGDEVLRVTAARAAAVVRGTDTVGRLGGDEFVVVLPGLESEGQLVNIARRLVAELSRPMQTEGQTVAVGASIGAALAPRRGEDGVAAADALLHKADQAVYRAKAQGKGRVVVFDDAMRAEAVERAAMAAALRTAIAHEQLVLHYQPVLDLASGHIAAVEALVRWERPGHGVAAPESFLPVAEDSDLICDLDRWVLRTALRQQAAWARAAADGRGPQVSVNLSRRHLARASVLDDVMNALADSGVDPGSLLVEVSEAGAVASAAVRENLQALRDLGVRVAVDDVGRSWTFAAELQHLPCDVVKVDRRLVARDGSGAAEVMALVVRAGHALGMSVVAEGVETSSQEAAVRAAGFDSAQGLLWSAAVPAPELDHLFAAGGARAVRS
ncbi:diguanylate cyclase (GGDEF) domain-containing protein [Quadrisphaera granulorum]|uniref:Diguanylate cyclase (GGDEF)-like protein n=1 Tax=Quadrisphaera granulorum TaxID=317664 RepID=A0A315ZS75_9ACTN|nr:EAL domain-containing protein [Quadrisphaera granulorum]PWJ47728.1 diguanylate cyclase (GGDEF)-like protein [Quadrisphaera granulorum]SZE98682.1 diguanylate cyclase (GGDEF) domain-containing protein [Quadrisphaera granulorum]